MLWICKKWCMEQSSTDRWGWLCYKHPENIHVRYPIVPGRRWYCDSVSNMKVSKVWSSQTHLWDGHLSRDMRSCFPATSGWLTEDTPLWRNRARDESAALWNSSRGSKRTSACELSLPDVSGMNPSACRPQISTFTSICAWVSSWCAELCNVYAWNSRKHSYKRVLFTQYTTTV